MRYDRPVRLEPVNASNFAGAAQVGHFPPHQRHDRGELIANGLDPLGRYVARAGNAQAQGKARSPPRRAQVAGFFGRF
jgi:hypothetical protein